MKISVNDIEVKKIILSGLQTSGYPFHKEMDKLLYGLLSLNFNAEISEISIQTASQFIVAYLQLGFSYLEHKTLFDSILARAGFSCDKIHNLQKQNPTIIINKSKIRSLLGRWPASSKNSHTINDAIDDIMHHALFKENGTYQYFTAKKDGSYTALYQLTISTDYIIFHDVFQNRYYSLTEK